MSVAMDLQTLIAGINGDIAGRKRWGRTELEKLRRSLTAIREDASRDGREIAATRRTLGELAVAAEEQSDRVRGLAMRLRIRMDALSDQPGEVAA